MKIKNFCNMYVDNEGDNTVVPENAPPTETVMAKAKELLQDHETSLAI